MLIKMKKNKPKNQKDWRHSSGGRVLEDLSSVPSTEIKKMIICFDQGQLTFRFKSRFF
jgi:hypothetical protein